MSRDNPENGQVAQWSRFLDALETACVTCGGQGDVTSHSWRAWYERAEELARVAEAARRAAGLRTGGGGNGFRPEAPPDTAVGAPSIVAAVERAMNEHDAAQPVGSRQVPCPDCGGTGRALSPVGLRLAEILTHHGFVRVEDPERGFNPKG
ncbi:hypothetical protein [Actinomadura sp. 6N118]|uniref:hypothetical protein n=1 Tax=Actinomadura sp. 6N118 TaxID=3375151 RepID=UPI0037C19F00